MKYLLFIFLIFFSGCSQQSSEYDIGIYTMFDMKTYEELGDYKFSHQLIYEEILNIDYTEIEDVWDRGYKPITTIEFLDPSGNDRLKAIINGTYDEQLIEFRDFVDKNEKMIQVRPLHEFNGDWYPWGIYYGDYNVSENTKLFKQAWIHIHNILDSPYIELQLNYNSKNGRAKIDSFESFYPGDEYVDVIGISSFNRAYLTQNHLYWEEFVDRFDNPYNQIINFTNKSIAISEMSTTSYGTGNSKPNWIYNTMYAIRYNYTQVKQISWFLVNVENHGRTEKDPRIRNWDLNTRADADAFNAGLQLFKE